jgi:hypothetical protein
MLKWALVTALSAGLLVSTASAGVSREPAFYVDGQTYRTVATPTDLSRTGAPAHAWDTIYEFGGLQLNVATAAPGDRDYNGGRWMVHALAFDDYPGAVAAHDANGSGDFDSDAEIASALDAGDATDLGVVKQFVCPVIKFPAKQR